MRKSLNSQGLRLLYYVGKAERHIFLKTEKGAVL